MPNSYDIIDHSFDVIVLGALGALWHGPAPAHPFPENRPMRERLMRLSQNSQTHDMQSTARDGSV